ncbi:3-oxoacyl-ACP synthase III family protein [Catenulispora pinistramenti]|uniref:3-oxoacyl-ACP synthase III family protein n=1 Tax=Catenulispora pinistramenti TaxID=2705254 RepID=UPI0039B552FE
MTEVPATGRLGVIGTGTYLPALVRTNDDIAAAAGVSAQWIGERTGIHTRHFAGPEQAASDLAAAAVRHAAADAGIDVRDISLLICATSTPDELGPSTACRVQALLGAGNAVALDVSAACSGWLFGVKVAHDWLRNDRLHDDRPPTGRRPGYAAVVGVEAYSKFIDPADRGTAVLFADGAAATVLGPVEDRHGFSAFEFGSDGTLADRVLIPAGGSRDPASPATVEGGGHRIHMDGRAVSRFIADTFPRLVKDALDRNGLTIADIDCLICHQPNPVLVRRIGRDAGIPDDRLVIVGDGVGNIGAASAPYALAKAVTLRPLNPGDRVLITVFGAGLTWGSALLTWGGRTESGPAPSVPTASVSAPSVSAPSVSAPSVSGPEAQPEADPEGPSS